MIEQNNKNRMDSTGPTNIVDNPPSGMGMGRTAMYAALAIAAVLAFGMWAYSGNNPGALSETRGATTGMSTTSPPTAAPATTRPSDPNGNNTK